MSSNSRKNPSKSVTATSRSSRQLPSTSESQLHSAQQQQPQPGRPDNPWSVLRPTFRSEDVPPSTSPFPRYGHTLSATSAGELLLFGGHARRSLRNDLYVFSTRDFSVTFLQTSGEVPSPRYMSAGVLVNHVLLIWGGATKLDDKSYATGPYDDSLYLLSLGTSFGVKTDPS